MASNDYVFVTHWRVEGTLEEVSAILDDGDSLPRWWPSVYLEVQTVKPGGPRGIGKVVRLHTKGWLPYTLRWEMEKTADRYPHGFSLKARGDFVGTGDWHFEQDGAWVNIRYDWRVRAEKPLLRWFSFLLKPVFAANHRWAMARGEESLKAELWCRRANH